MPNYFAIRKVEFVEKRVHCYCWVIFFQSKVDNLDDTIDFPPSNGLYKEAYKTTLSVGKGAFGFVKLAQRRTDHKEVVIL